MKHFIPSLKSSIQKLKLLTSSLSNEDKLSLYEKHFSTAPKCVRKYLQISDSDYDNIKGKNNQSDLKRDSSKDESDGNDLSEEKSENKDQQEETKTPSLISRCQVVMSSRTKSLEELPSVTKTSDKKEESGTKTPKYKPRSKSKVFSSEKLKLNKSKSNSSSEEDITEFIKDGAVAYTKLIKHEISKFDILLLEAAKKSNNIGGN